MFKQFIHFIFLDETKRRHYLLSFLLLLPLISFSQNPHPYFRNYTTDDGLPSPEVHYCLEDNQGFMWFATDNGISRFDGYEFKNYGPREGLKHSVVFDLQKDSKGRLWIGTMNGDLYYLENDTIHPFEQNFKIEELNIKSNFLRDFYIDALDNKYLSIGGSGILKFYPDGKSEQIICQNKESERLFIRIKNRWISGGGTSKVFERKNNIHAINKLVTEIRTDSISLIQLPITALPRSSRGNYWMIQLDPSSDLSYQYEYLFESKNGKPIWSKPFPFDIGLKGIMLLPEGAILLGFTKKKGLRFYENITALKEERFEQYLSDISISHIYKDSKGALWLSSIENGVFYCPDIKQRIYDKSAGLSANYVSAFDFKDHHEIFVGLRDGKVYSINDKEETLTKLPDYSGQQIVYDLLYEPSRAELWVTKASGIVHFTDGIWNATSQYDLLQRKILIPYKKMTLSRNGNYLWGTSHVGFGGFDLSEKENLKKVMNPIFQERSFRVWEDQQHRIWVANISGLYEFKNNQLIRPEPFFAPFETRAEDIGELADGTLVIGTKGEGVLFWKDSLFQQVTMEDGLSSDMIENVYVDFAQNIWVGTLKGLNKINRSDTTFEVKTFTIFHGLPSNEINQVKVKGDEIWIATTKGLIKWKEPVQEIFSRKPFIEQVLVNNEPVNLSTQNEFGYLKNNLTFQYLTINFRSQGKINYRYRLNEETWVTTRNRSVNFARLSSDLYRFEVQAQNEDGYWSESSFYNFEIKIPFWKRNWFVALGIFFFFLLMRLFYQNRIKNLRKEEAIKQEINDLQNAALRAQMNPHFIFNCLNSIQNLINMDDKENASRYLVRFARLIRTALKSSINKTISLHDEIGLLESYLELEKLRFKDKFNFQIEVDAKLDQYDVALPPMLIQSYVENSIVHGFAERESGGVLHIHFQDKDQQLEVTIADNGIGYYQSQKNKVARHEGHESFGMSISNQRIALMDTSNEVSIEEVKDAQGQVKGTRVRLVINN